MAAIGRRNRRDVVGYHQAHHRLFLTRGPARNHPCVDCAGVAEDWSYNGHCDEELSHRGTPYCLHFEHYSSRCKSCHVKLDRQRDRAGRFLPKDGAA